MGSMISSLMEGNGSEANIAPSHTELDPEVQIPWLQTFELGQGFDAVKGHYKVSPFRDIRSLEVIPDSDLPTFDVKFKTVHGRHEISNKRRIHGQGTINAHSPLTLEASFASERSSSDSEASFMIEQYASGEYHFETLNMDELQLTDEAQALLDESPREFRDRYGDYFIVGYQRRFTFNALIECYTSDEQYTKQTEEDAQLALQNILGGSVGYTKNTKNSNFRLSAVAHISESGCDFSISNSSPGNSAAIEDVSKMVEELKMARPNGRKDIALLRRYSQLYNSLPNTAPVAPGLFDELHNLDSTAWELESSQFHPAHSHSTVRSIEDALKTFAEGRSSFVNDGASLKRSQDAFSEVKKLVDVELHRYNFIQQVILESRDSPVSGNGSNPDQKWNCGFVVVTARQPESRYITLDNGIEACEVVLEATPRLRATDFIFSSSRSQGSLTRTPRGITITFGPGADGPQPWATMSGMTAYIVGWTLSCRTTTQVKKTFKVQSGGLTYSGLKISVDPVGILRPSTWRCRIYFVDRDRYFKF